MKIGIASFTDSVVVDSTVFFSYFRASWWSCGRLPLNEKNAKLKILVFQLFIKTSFHPIRLTKSHKQTRETRSSSALPLMGPVLKVD